MSLLQKYSNILIDAPALALLHSRNYKKFLPIVLAKYNVYLTRLCIMEFLSLLNYYKYSYDYRNILNYFNKFYKVKQLSDEIIHRAAVIYSDLMKRNIFSNIVDVIHAAISIEENMILLTSDTQRYEVFLKYGIIFSHVDDLISLIKAEASRT